MSREPINYPYYPDYPYYVYYPCCPCCGRRYTEWYRLPWYIWDVNSSGTTVVYKSSDNKSVGYSVQ